MKLPTLPAVLCALAATSAYAFHDGGVAECDGCHTIHNSSDGLPEVGAAGGFLLRKSDGSSVCLNCHAGTAIEAGGHRVFTTDALPGAPPANFTPGGDFGWLMKSYTFDGSGVPGGVGSSPGEHHGHSVVASDYGLTADTTRVLAPGGTYPSDRLRCTSCHDPHGRYRILTGGAFATSGDPTRGSGSYGDGLNFLTPSPGQAVGAYRLLAGAGYVPKSSPGVPPFSANPPVALAPSAYNRSERYVATRVAYGSGMSEWCRNCHPTKHTESSGSTLRHPSDNLARLTAEIQTIYNTYVRTGDLSGSALTAYWSLVPFEEGTSDRTMLAPHARSDGTALEGPSTTANVQCLVCHRAHASGWNYAIRWNHASDLIVADGQWPGINATSPVAAESRYAQGRTVAETRGAMYERDPAVYATNQFVLCQKCHNDSRR